jgi:hypothetical protein
MNDTEEKLIMENWKNYINEINPYKDENGHFTSKEKAKVYSLTKRAEKHLAKDTEVEAPARGRVTGKGKISSKFGMNTGSPDKQCGRLTIDGEKKSKTRSCKDYPKTYKEDLSEEPDIPPERTEEPQLISLPKIKNKPRKRAIKVRIGRKPRGLKEKDNTKRPVSKMDKLDKVFPGYADIKRLSRGITENQDVHLSLEQLLSALKTLVKEDSSNSRIITRELNKVGFFNRTQVQSQCRSMERYSLADWLEITDKQALASKGELNKPPKA